MAGELTARVPLSVFFPELDETVNPRIPQSLWQELYSPLAQGATVFHTLLVALDMWQDPATPKTTLTDLGQALEDLFIALVPFSHDNVVYVLPAEHLQRAYSDQLDALEPLNNHMQDWCQGWLAERGIDTWGNFSDLIMDNTTIFLHVINSTHPLYTGVARHLDSRGSLSIDTTYEVDYLIEDFLNPYNWLLELTGQL